MAKTPAKKSGKVDKKKAAAAKAGAAAANVAAYAAAATKDPTKALSMLAAAINKDIGDGSIIYGDTQLPNVDFISTNIATLDAVIGGGLPRGRITEIFGLEGGGKTTTTLEIIAACQRTYFDKFKRKGVCAFIDAEHALDPVWAKNIGVSMKDLLLNQPAHGEEAFRVLEAIVKSGLVDVVIVDSVAALIPKEELDGEVTDNKIGAHARLMSKGMKRIAGIISDSSTACVFINQIRNKIGVMFGNPETTTGGLALKFAASVRIDLRRGETIKSGEEPIGVTCKAKIIKNKVAPPYKNCIYNIYFGTTPDGAETPVYGVDKISCLLDAAILYGVITLGGSNYYFNEQRIGAGRDKSAAALQGSPELVAKIRTALMEAVKPIPGVNLADADDDELDANLAQDEENVDEAEEAEAEDTEEAEEASGESEPSADEEEIEDLTTSAK